jgi:hypothetical protein
MPNVIIKTIQKDTLYKGNQMYILNKGMNSSKPQKEPFTNRFIILFQNDEDAETVYWLAYSLWKAKFWSNHYLGPQFHFKRRETPKLIIAPITARIIVFTISSETILGITLNKVPDAVPICRVLFDSISK